MAKKEAADRKVKKEATERKRYKAKPKHQGEYVNKTGHQEKTGGKGFADGIKSRKGCFPKLLMLLLPFMAIGAYLFLWS